MKYFLHDPHGEESAENRCSYIVHALTYCNATLRSVTVNDRGVAVLTLPKFPDEGYILHWEDIKRLEDEGIINRHTTQ
jgi:hypothetical protein